jgi:SAM-dependent methyltransferase
MTDSNLQVAYWDAAATSKTFHHPVHFPWLDNLNRGSRILDYGCGYGRIMALLHQHGFTNLTGVDASRGMIAQARLRNPEFEFLILDAPPRLIATTASFDVVMLFAVLCCMPGDDAQRTLIAELRRVLKPGGLLYISDMPLQDDVHNRARYASLTARYGVYGVFETDDGAICRHHSNDWLSALLVGFDSVQTRHIAVTTMNGHRAVGIQFLARKPAR